MIAPNAAPDPSADPRAFLQYLFEQAVRSALPSANLAGYLPRSPVGRTVVLGAGKASAAMAQAVESAWPSDAPLSGLVVTRYGHIPPQKPQDARVPRIELLQAAHPVPDAAGMLAAQRILALTQGLTADDLVLCLISGGGSSLLTLPCEGLSLDEKRAINQALLASGASIGEMNCVRKHLSSIKGGRLAAACGRAPVLTLAISDVPGDDPSVIASGPTVPDPTSCVDALAVLRRYGIALPSGVHQRLLSGELETPKPGQPTPGERTFRVVATPRAALQAAAQAARAAGLAAHILGDDLEGESREVGKVHAALARAIAVHGEPFGRPCVLLSGGETTVSIRSQPAGGRAGRGGRAGEFCMGLAQALQGQPGIYALAADTDGIDGVEDNAGAIVTPDTLARAALAGQRIEDYLDRNDAYGYFSGLNDLVVTGPTFTNVNDFRAVLIR
jgi:hydroxypyruvate reductase